MQEICYKRGCFVERTRVRTWGWDRGTQEELKTGTHIGSREKVIRVEKDFRGCVCSEEKQGTNIESS